MGEVLAYVLGVVVLIGGVGVSVALHELGHMLPAKRFGVKVPQYFIGFGPRVWSVRCGETEYGVKAIWLGGFVRLCGMLPPAPPGRVDRPGSAVEQARAESLAELGPGEEHRAFYRLSVPRKLAVMAGGILTNLVLGVVLIAVASGVIGVPGYVPRLSQVATCVAGDVDATAGSPQAACSAEDDAQRPAPAASAGLEVGDLIVSWNGEPVRTWAQVQAAIAAGGTSTAAVVIERDGRRRTVEVTPVEVTRRVVDAQGQVVRDASGQAVTETVPYVGISPQLGTVRAGGGEVASQVAGAVVGTLKAVVTIPVGLYRAAAAAVGLEERDPQGLVSLVGVGRLAGQVASAGVGEQASGAVPMRARVSFMVSLLGSLNLALFAFNLVPLLPLDGGHVAGACWEGVRRWAARRRGERGVIYADTARMLPVGQVVVVLLIVMALILVWADVVAPA